MNDTISIETNISDNLPYTYCEQTGKEIRDISGEIPFDIPESWEWCRLSDILLKLTDGTHSTPKYIENGVPFISVKDVSTGKLNFSNCKYISEKEHIELYERCNPEIGDILLTKVGTTGIPVIVDTERQFSLFVSVALLKFNQELIYNRYLMYMINSPLVQKQAIENTKGVGNKNWVMRDIANTLIVIPPIEEQNRIVSKIEELLPYIEEYDKAETELSALNETFPEMLKKSILQEAVQGKLVPQDPNDEPASVLLERIKAEKQRLIKEGKIKKDKQKSSEITSAKIPYEIPESWVWCYISDIAFVTKLAGFEYTKSIFPNLTTDGIPLFKGKNVQNGRLVLEFESYIPESLSDELYRSQINKKCLLTPYVGTIGNIAIFDGSFKAHLGSNVGKIELFNSNEDSILEEYVLFYLKSQYGYEQLTKHKKATAQESISIENIRNVLIAIPPIEEQKRIVRKIDKIMQIINKL